eukprot:EG_transcript_1600
MGLTPWYLASVLYGLGSCLSLLLQISAAAHAQGRVVSAWTRTLAADVRRWHQRAASTMNLPPLPFPPPSPNPLRLHSRRGSLLLCKPVALPRSPAEAERQLSIIAELTTSIVQSHGGTVVSGAARDVSIAFWELSPSIQPEILACGCAMFLRQRLEAAVEAPCSIVLHSGEFQIIEAGGRFPWPCAVGDEYHLAHRLLYALEDKPSSIAVTDSVHRAVSEAFSTVELSPVLRRGSSSLAVFALQPGGAGSPTSPSSVSVSWKEDSEQRNRGRRLSVPNMPMPSADGRHLSPPAPSRRRRGSSPVANELPHLSVRMYASADNPNHLLPHSPRADPFSNTHLQPEPNNVLLSPSSRQVAARRRTQSLAVPTFTVSIFDDSPAAPSGGAERIPAVLVEATEALRAPSPTEEPPEEEPTSDGAPPPSAGDLSDDGSQRQHMSPQSDRPSDADIDAETSSNTLGARAASIQWAKRVVYYDDPNTRENTETVEDMSHSGSSAPAIMPTAPQLPLHRWQALAEEYTAVLSRGNSEITTDDSRRGSVVDKTLSPLRSFRHASFFSNSARLTRHCSAPSIHRHISTPGSHYSMQQDGRFQTEDEWWETLNPMKRHWSLSALLSKARMITTVKPNGDTESWHCSQHLLGKGSYGEVCLGMSKVGLLVAIKRIRVEEEMKRQLMTEIKLLGKIQHENIIQYYGSCVEGGHVLLVTEYACTTLAKVLAAFGKLTSAVAGRFMRDIVTGLRYLHGRGVVHRDIKPENVLMNQLGVCKLADFGTATFLSRSLRNSGEIAGTPQFIAPEVVNGEVSMAADIWAVGVTLWFALLAKPLVDSTTSNTWAVLYRVGSMEETPVIPEEVTGDARAFLTSCLAIHPDHRATAADLLSCPFLARCTLSPSTADSVWQT